jgi:hypothetical protein
MQKAASNQRMDVTQGVHSAAKVTPMVYEGVTNAASHSQGVSRSLMRLKIVTMLTAFYAVLNEVHCPAVDDAWQRKFVGFHH